MTMPDDLPPPINPGWYRMRTHPTPLPERIELDILPDVALLSWLSLREHECLRGRSLGLGNAGTARMLSIGEQTVKNHMTNVYAKLGILDGAEETVGKGERACYLLGVNDTLRWMTCQPVGIHMGPVVGETVHYRDKDGQPRVGQLTKVAPNGESADLKYLRRSEWLNAEAATHDPSGRDAHSWRTRAEADAQGHLR